MIGFSQQPVGTVLSEVMLLEGATVAAIYQITEQLICRDSRLTQNHIKRFPLGYAITTVQSDK